MDSEKAHVGTDAPRPSAEHRELELFPGEWHSEGEWKAGPTGVAGKFSALVQSEWLPGNFFLIFRSKSEGPLGESRSLGIWGYDNEQKVYTHHSFASDGKAKLEKGTLQGNAWVFLGETVINGRPAKSRFIDRVVSRSQLNMTGEVSIDDSPWVTIMEGVARKAASPSAVIDGTFQHSGQGPGREHEKLYYFPGSWHSEGKLIESPLGPGGYFSQTVDCKLLPGGFFLLFRSKQNGPLGEVYGVGVWGYDSEKKVYTHHSFNSRGSAKLETGTLEGNAWIFLAEFPLRQKRMKTRFIDRVIGNQLQMTGELSVEGGPWVSIMEGTATKIA
ncbi:MAG: DUF1579 family protein [Acidobacteria bacterium]|nr:DUF1579 family protein [Acidobacteriota bacterium]